LLEKLVAFLPENCLPSPHSFISRISDPWLTIFLRTELLNNTIENYFWFVGILLFGYLFKTLVSKLLSELMFRMLKKYSQDVNKFDFRRLLITPLEFLTFPVLYLHCFRPAELSQSRSAFDEVVYWKRILLRVYRAFLIVSVTWVTMRLVDFVGLIFMKRAEKTLSKMDDQLVPFFKDFAKSNCSNYRLPVYYFLRFRPAGK
jgi:MscS family membrane protein